MIFSPFSPQSQETALFSRSHPAPPQVEPVTQWPPLAEGLGVWETSAGVSVDRGEVSEVETLTGAPRTGDSGNR